MKQFIWLNIVKENKSNHKDKIGVFNPILKTDDKLSVMPNTTSRYYILITCDIHSQIVLNILDINHHLLFYTFPL
jgi:hypothetical protein